MKSRNLSTRFLESPSSTWRKVKSTFARTANFKNWSLSSCCQRKRKRSPRQFFFSFPFALRIVIIIKVDRELRINYFYKPIKNFADNITSRTASARKRAKICATNHGWSLLPLHLVVKGRQLFFSQSRTGGFFSFEKVTFWLILFKINNKI